MQRTTVPPGPSIDPASGAVTFRVDPGLPARPVRVWYHLRDFGADPSFRSEDGQWVARIPRPPVDRLEYLLEVCLDSGETVLICDPAHPHRVAGVFGEKSELRFDEYREPWWLSAPTPGTPPATGADDPLGFRGAWVVTARPAGDPAAPERDLRRDRWSEVAGAAESTDALTSAAGPEPWAPRAPSAPLADTDGAGAPASERPTQDAGLEEGLEEGPGARDSTGSEPGQPRRAAGSLPRDERRVHDDGSDLDALGLLLTPSESPPQEELPLLAVHDGPEYAQLAGLLDYLAAARSLDPALRCRVLLLTPVDRDRSYSASPGYSRALSRLLAQVRSEHPVRGPVVGVGASLGGLAMLHLALTHPGSIDVVFSQSGSFFRRDTDLHESGYRFFDRISDFVASIPADPALLRGVTVGMTCGTGEDNLDNNRRLLRVLQRSGAAATLVENRDGHTYPGWRDCLDPALTDLLRAAWRPGQRSPHQRSESPD